MGLLLVFGCGFTFGLGLIISDMIDPSRVLSFLDVFGHWDPSLAFVMGAAVVVTGIGYRWVLGSTKPFFEENFQVPTRIELDLRLITGAVIFGAGWGLVGLCPGPAIAALVFEPGLVFVFVLAMLAGMFLAGRVKAALGKV